MDVQYVKIIYPRSFQPDFTPGIDQSGIFKEEIEIGQKFGDRKVDKIEINEEKYIIKIKLDNNDVLVYPMGTIKYYSYKELQ